ncbi:hypothetical protein [Kaistella carnis]|uniref:hypothetical protein n=1 Tax=Kaistella carnis TaxID=1241979 RepID=UPI0028AA9BC2|nr:hypothetical protein [Kaistella carnis]
MKRLSLILFLLICHVMGAQSLKEFRALIKQSEKSEKASKSLIEKSTAAYVETKEPIYGGFMAVGNFFMAKHAFNPIKKISYFNQGKRTLENAVKAEPHNIEIRLMRLITQENIPNILGYHQHIKEDRAFIRKEYQKIEDRDLKNFVIDYLKL